jgi:pyruvate formate lyase activating enzyme
MKIHGLQKMTLLDFPGRVACTVFFGGCDMRCPFCHNAELIDGTAPAVMEEEELLSFLEKRKGLLDGVAVTGGEPTLQKDLTEFFRKIKAMGYPVKLDTNGMHPERLEKLITEKLVDYVAMDIKNSFVKYAMTVGVKNAFLDKISQTIKFLMTSGIDYEFRTTLVKEFHERMNYEEFLNLIKGAKRLFLQKFVDREGCIKKGLHEVDVIEANKLLDYLQKEINEVSLRCY